MKNTVNYKIELNPQQYQAVKNLDGPALVIAGAGSGKTRTLTYRVAYLLDQNINPENILLLTFTNKASQEMLNRVNSIIPIEQNTIWGGTFHSICNRILRKHPIELKLTHSFSILDREDQLDLLNTIVNKFKEANDVPDLPKARVLAEIFSLSLNTQKNIYKVIEEKFPYFEKTKEIIKSLHDKYTQAKLDNNSVDFDDLLIHTLTLFKKNKQLREYYQDKFKHILVDEYQDTNSIQSQLIDVFAQKYKNLMVVGDDAQSIYSWRGANFKNILNFQMRYPDAKIFKIETNYRSAPEILKVANESITHNTEQFEKNLNAQRPAKAIKPILAICKNPSHQAQFITQKIKDIVNKENIPPREIAVLYRAHFHSMEIQMELTNRFIPFKITSGLRFFEQAHIKDLSAFVRLAVNRNDEVAFKRICKLFPAVGVKTAEKLWQKWLNSEIVTNPNIKKFSNIMLDFKPPAKAKNYWTQFALALDEMILDDENITHLKDVNDMFRTALNKIYNSLLEITYPNPENRLQDIEQLIQYSSTFIDAEEFLAQLSLLTNLDENMSNSEDSITLSTIHQAKGLEWKVVFIIWLAEGMFPNNKTIEKGNLKDMEEERRLFYVAITRAKDELYLSYPKFWPQSRTGNYFLQSSQFLDEISEKNLDTWQCQ